MKISNWIWSIIAVLSLNVCNLNASTVQPDKNLGIIPQPTQVTLKNANAGMQMLKVYIPAQWYSSYYSTLFAEVTAVQLSTQKEANVVLIEHPNLLPEHYQLDINQDRVIIKASNAKGFQYGLVSLVQMVQYLGFPLPQVSIEDAPKFGYRGMHLDVSRHFFTIDEVKQHLDYLAYYKFNRFHWHLTDDQGWRIEIKKYPKLQEIAAYRDETLIGHYSDQPHKFDGVRYGGYYTQEMIRDIVQYAADRNIEVIPEVDIPGHSQATLSAYPEFGCENKAYKAATLWGVFEDVLCPNEATFKFLEDVMDELMALFPGKYIHIGGDECPKVAWKNSAFCQELIKRENLGNEEGLQSYFIRRVAAYIQSKGREIIGWDEILEGGLAQGAVVMSWRGVDGGLEAAAQNHDVIMTPNSHCYFDYYQSEAPGEPISIGGFIPIEKVYDWDPIPSELAVEKRKYILGGQANLWTEYIKTYSHVQYMSYARGMALSETLWSSDKDYRRFLNKFEQHYNHWKKKGANVAFHIYDLKYHVQTKMGMPVQLYFDAPEQASIYYNLDDQVYNLMDGKDTLTIEKSGKYTFVASKNNQRGRPMTLNFNLHKGTRGQIQLETLPSSRYAGRGPYSLINGLNGPDSKYGGSEWLGYSGDDCIGTIELAELTSLQQVAFRFFKGEGQWIYLPSEVEVLISEDGKHFKSIHKTKDIQTNTKVASLPFSFNGEKAKFIKFVIKNHGVIEAGRQGAGYKAWLFVDEITIE